MLHLMEMAHLTSSEAGVLFFLATVEKEEAENPTMAFSKQ